MLVPSVFDAIGPPTWRQPFLSTLMPISFPVPTAQSAYVGIDWFGNPPVPRACTTWQVTVALPSVTDQLSHEFAAAPKVSLLRASWIAVSTAASAAYASVRWSRMALTVRRLVAAYPRMPTSATATIVIIANAMMR